MANDLYFSRAYTPPQSPHVDLVFRLTPASVDLYFSQAYTPPAPNAVNLHFGESPVVPPVSGVLSAVCQAAYLAAIQASVRLPDPRTGVISTTLFNSCSAAISGVYDNAVRRLINGAASVLHQSALWTPMVWRIPWGRTSKLRPAYNLPFAPAMPLRDAIDVSWGISPHLRYAVRMLHEDAEHSRCYAALPFDTCIKIHTGAAIPHKRAIPIQILSAVPYIVLLHLHRQLVCPYQHANTLAIRRRIPGSPGVPLFFHRRIPWQQAQRPPFVWPPISPIVPPQPPPIIWGADLYFKCPAPLHADLIFGVDCAVIIPERSTYMIDNVVSLVRLPERTPLAASNIRVSIDVDSWCWAFSATLTDAASLDLVMPDSQGNPVSVEADINGWQWICMVEGWQENRAFGSNSWSISGRSVSAQLSEPYAPSRSTVAMEDRTAQQLAALELADTGWTLIWNAVDWLAPAGVYSYMRQTPIQAIQRIVQAIGGVLQTDAHEMQLIVQPRYVLSPWQWASATPALSLPDSLISTIGRQWVIRPRYDAAFISGQTQGVVVHGIRAGQAGNNPAPTVTDALITHVDAGRERARNILAAGGRWDISTIAIPLMAAPDVPGLVLPGVIIEVVESGTAWRGQVIGTSVQAAWNNGVTVTQTLEVERYYG